MFPCVKMNFHSVPRRSGTAGTIIAPRIKESWLREARYRPHEQISRSSAVDYRGSRASNFTSDQRKTRRNVQITMKRMNTRTHGEVGQKNGLDQHLQTRDNSCDGGAEAFLKTYALNEHTEILSQIMLPSVSREPCPRHIGRATWCQQ